MKRFLRSKLVLSLAAFLMIAAAVVIPLSGSIIHSHAQAATITPTNITGKFFTNTDFSNGTFNRTPSDTPVFTQPFQALNFNPDPSMQNCTPSTGVDNTTRPFTDVYPPIANGSCPTVIAQGNGAQAGVDNGVASLQAFEAEFQANLTVPSAGTMTTTITADDGFSLYVGPNGSQQPTPAPGNPMVNPPGSTGPFTGYPEMGDNNQPSSPTAFTIVTNFPAAGTYPMELDYTECCNATLTLVMSNSFTPTQTPSISLAKAATSTVSPGGTVNYTLTLTNTSPAGSANLHDIHINDVLPAPPLTAITKGPTFTVTPTGGGTVDCSSSSGLTVSCFVDNFTPGAIVTITFSASVSTSATGTITNKATAQSSVVSANASANTMVITPKHQKLFVLIQGINTALSKDDIDANGGYGMIPDFSQSVGGGRGHKVIPGIVSVIQSQFPNAKFLAFSYGGSNPFNGKPLEYNCLDTFVFGLNFEATELSIQLKGYLSTQPKNTITDIYLIGHSLGGAVALSYLTAYLEAPQSILPLPANGHLAGVITLDSPVGGVSGNDGFVDFTFNLFKEQFFGLRGCFGLTDQKTQFTSVMDLVNIFNTTSKPTHPPTDDGNPGSQGAHASILKAIFKGSALTNQAVMEMAAAQGIPILTIGNTIDFLYNPSACDTIAPHVTFTTSQWVGDEGPKDSAKEHHPALRVYGREFTAGDSFCPTAAPFDLVNHFQVYHNTDVETALTQFLPNGGAPSALDVAPPEP